MLHVFSKAKILGTAAVGALALGAAVPAQAGDLSVSFGFDSYGARSLYDGYDRDYRPAHRYEREYRPAYRYRHGYRPAYGYGHYGRPSKRVVVEHYDEDDIEECRMIVKRRHNRFGDLVVKRIRICD